MARAADRTAGFCRLFVLLVSFFIAAPGEARCVWRVRNFVFAILNLPFVALRLCRERSPATRLLHTFP
jgi:hypothetical protein